jgi:hypothetical protein
MTMLESSKLGAIACRRESERESGERRFGSGVVSANQRVWREEEEGRVLGENVHLCDHPCRY